MWITEVDDGRFYDAEARSHGSVYRTRVSVDEAAHGSVLRMDFTATPVALTARIMLTLLGFLIRRSVISAFGKDLDDIKRAAESVPS